MNSSFIIWQWIESQKGVVYVCGLASTMLEMLLKRLKKVGGLFAEDDKNYVGVSINMLGIKRKNTYYDSVCYFR